MKPHLIQRILAGLLLIVTWGILIAEVIKVRASGQLLFPFVWTSVAIVQVVCSLPLAFWFVHSVLRRRNPWGILLAVTLLFVGSFVLFQQHLHPPYEASLLVGLRLAMGLFLATASVACLWLIGGKVESPSSTYLLLVGLVAWILLPAIYIDSRCRHETNHLTALLEQSRLGEARIVVEQLTLLDPERICLGQPLKKLATQVEEDCRGLEKLVATPLSASATDRDHLNRAGQLAMLGRTDEALITLPLLLPIDSPLAADTDNLRGTIHETREEWSRAEAAYRSAGEGWSRQSASAEQRAGLTQALTGIAYSQRKSGRYEEAEVTYQKLLNLSPNADTHYLLAQFYEDTQQTDSAQTHAQRAMALSPKRYQKSGQELLNKMAIYHFGCLNVSLGQEGTSGSGKLRSVPAIK
jgi:hypothetical protein